MNLGYARICHVSEFELKKCYFPRYLNAPGLLLGFVLLREKQLVRIKVQMLLAENKYKEHHF